MSYSYDANIREIEKYNLEKRKEELREIHRQEREMKAKQIGGITDSELIYYNITMKNNNTGYNKNGTADGNDTAIIVDFNEARSQPYINCASDYYMSVIRFNIDTPEIPILIVQPYQKWTQINKLVYQIAIQTGGTDYKVGGVIWKRNIDWVPEDSSAVAPVGSVPVNYTDYPYYYCYTPEYFINLVNKTIALLFTDAGLTQKPPFISIVDGYLYWSIDHATVAIARGLYLNTSLYNLFSQFQAIRLPEPFIPASNVDTYGLNYFLVFSDDNSGYYDYKVYTNLTTTPITSPYTASSGTSQCSPFATWNPVDSIIFTTSLLPVVPELVAAPAIYGQPYSDPYVSVQKPEIIVDPITFNTTLVYPQSHPNNSDVLSVLTDYAADIKGYNNPYAAAIYYEPISEFKLTDLYDEKPINQLQISVYWKDKFGLKHPMKLCSGGTASIKIMFRKKEV